MRGGRRGPRRRARRLLQPGRRRRAGRRTAGPRQDARPSTCIPGWTTPSSTRTVPRSTTRTPPRCCGSAPWRSCDRSSAERGVVPEGPGPGLVEDYLTLGLRLGRHIDGMVDAYYGPTALAHAVEAEPLLSPDRLVASARALLAGTRGRWGARPVGGPGGLGGAGPAALAGGPGPRTGHHVRQARWRAHRLRRRGGGLLRRPSEPGRRGRARRGPPAARRGAAGQRSAARAPHGLAGIPRRAGRPAATGRRLTGRLAARSDPRAVRPARGRAHRVRTRDRRAVVRLQLLPR